MIEDQLRLLLLRHAKSSWNRPGRPDRERPLNERGEAAASLIGSVIEERGLTPRVVLCSTAERARQTWERVLPELGSRPDVLYDHAIYDADAEELLAVIRRKGGTASPLLLIGHNPGIQRLALGLAAGEPDRRTDRISTKYPTAALTVLDAGIGNWSDLAHFSATLADFICPRDLE